MSDAAERWQRLEELFDAALALTEPERSAFLEEHSRGDDALRTDLEFLLTVSSAAETFFTRIGDGVRETIARELVDLSDPWIGTALHQYRIEARLGAGGMGVVYRARDEQLRRTVALKLLPAHLTDDERARSRFLNEARAVAALDHANICAIHEAGESDTGVPFLAMALCEGEPLKTRIARGRIPVDEALDIATQIANGLAFAHRRGIVHRDIKPGNVMLGDDGVIKLVDFGLARLPDATMTATGPAPGTIAYMAPEQLQGEPSDARADLWALGVVLHEMLAGARPFESDSAGGLGYAIVHSEPVPLAQRVPEVPPAVSDVVGRLLEKERELRYATADALLADLAAARAGEPLAHKTRNWVPRRDGHPGGHKPWSRARRWAVVLTGVSAAALAAVMVARGVRRPPTLPPPPFIALGILPVEAGPEIGLPLTDEIANQLTTSLGGVAGVRLAAPRTLQTYLNRDVPLDSISRVMGVDYFVAARLARGRADTLEAGVSVITSGVFAQVGGTTRLAWPEAFEPATPLDSVSLYRAATLAQRLAVRVLDVLRQEIRARTYLTGTRDVRAGQLLRLASQEAALGLRSMSQGDLPGAVEQFDSAHDLFRQSADRDPAWDVPRLERARFAETRALAALMIGHPPDEVRRTYDEGVGALNEILRRSPEHPVALGLRGRLRWQRLLAGEAGFYGARATIDSIVDDLRTATALASQLAQPASDYAEVLLEAVGDYGQAAIHAQRALDVDAHLANAPANINRLGRIRLELEQDSAAADLCARGARDYPDAPEHYACLLEVMAWGTTPARPDSAWAWYRTIERFANAGARVQFGYALAAVLARAGVPLDSTQSMLRRMTMLVDSTPPESQARVEMLALEAGVWFRAGDRRRGMQLYSQLQRADSARARLLATRRVLRGFVVASD